MSSELRSATFTISVDGQEKGSSIVSIVKSVEQLEAVEQELNKTSATNVKITKSQTSTQKEANAMARLAIKEYTSQQKAIENVTTQLQNEIKMLSMTSEQQQIFNAQLRAGVDPLSAAGKNIESLVVKQQLLAKASGVSQSSFKGLKGQAQNLGWQLQDVAVQAQMGTSAFTILGQQGSQLASGFGPAGALVGAVIAVGSAIAGVAFSTKGLKEAQEITKVSTIGLTKELYEQAKAGKAVTDNQKAYLITIQKEKIKNYATEQAKLAKELAKNEEEVRLLKEQMERAKNTTDEYMRSMLPGTIGVFEKKISDLTGTISAQKATIDSVAQASKDASKELESLSKGEKFEDNEDTVARLKDEAEAVAEATKSWKDRVATIGLSERAAALYTLQSDATTAAEKAAIPVQSALINLYYDKKDAIDNEVQATKDKIAANKALIKTITAEEKAIDKRATALDKIEKAQIKEEQVSDPVAAEIALFQQNNKNLQDMKNAAGEYAITEQIRINGLIESEEDRHASAMQSAYLTQAQSYSSMGALMAASASSIVDMLSTGGEDIKAQMEDMNAIQKLMFLSTQAFVAADSVLAGYQQASNWLKSPLAASAPLVAEGLASASVSMGYANAGVVMGTTLAGAFDKGGVIPAGQAGIVAEYGDELVGGTMVYNNSNSGLGVTGREDTAAMMGSGSQSNTIYQNITVSGSGDKALQQAMQAAAKKGAEEGYKMVATDLKNNRGVSQYTARRNR